MLNKHKRNCPYCDNEAVYYLRYSILDYYKCLNCDLIYKISNKSYEEVVLKYRDQFYDKYGATETDGNRNALYSNILNFIEKKIKIGNLLDVGTGCGFFLRYAKERGWKVSGIDPSLKSVEFAQKNHNLNVSANTLKQFNSADKFDVITFINVLSHSAKPWKEIELAKKLLKPKGQIFIRCPNGFLHSHILKICSKLGIENYVSKLLVFHEYSFTARYIKRFLSDQGFTKIFIQNSPPAGDLSKMLSIETAPFYFLGRLVYFMSKFIQTISLSRFFSGSSLWVVAHKHSHDR